ncbi:RNA-binding domain-containing protein [Coprinopsis marcescibilis]|uniref:RNA-binding domain-containing protein n=1 Tax=Coprinopsis marcescibilis TaxID=230819 RepID=A0A5C3L9X1_COPMA|nr:RNA-binding domain-containing protein [Coprinopsis marcescibilis]
MSDAPAAQVTENGAPVVEQQQETPGFKVFAGNLSYTTTDEGLKAFFAPVQSDILSVQVILRGTRSAGYGFVALATQEAAQKAADTLNKQELDGRQVIVEIAKPAEQKDQEKKERKAKRRPGRRGGKAVPGEVTEAEANGEAPKAEAEAAITTDGEGKAKRKKRKSPRKKRSTDPAAPVEGEAAPADANPGADGADANKKAPRVRKPRTPRPARPAGEDPAGEPSKSVLFVANLGFTVDDEALAALFTDAGIEIVNARIVRRRWGQPRKSKGYGFVDVGTEENQKKAIAALEGKEVAGRPIAVKVAVNTPQENADDAADEAATPAAFLTELPDSKAAKTKTYSQIRKDAQKRSQVEQERHRLKSRRVLEQESREEGLSKSLFERAKEEEDAGIASGSSKAFSIMKKMGFKPGQSLGAPSASDSPPQLDQPGPPTAKLDDPSTDSPAARATANDSVSSSTTTWDKDTTSRSQFHRTEPLPLREWTGKRGIGLGKRARSPDATERLAKISKMAEEADHRDFRERARDDYHNRRAEGRLGPAQLTCATLDEQTGKEFNVLWLNPNNQNSFPSGLFDALAMHSNLIPGIRQQGNPSDLRKQMQADALQPIGEDDDMPQKKVVDPLDQYPTEVLEEATQFLRLQAQDRLRLVLSYLRARHHYCFWCGIKYDNEEEMEDQCPGSEEDDHD